MVICPCIWLFNRIMFSMVQYVYIAQITDVIRLMNMSVDRLLSVRARTVDRFISQRIFLCTICALQHLCTNRQPNICAHTFDEYFGRPFAVAEMLICNLYTIYKYRATILSRGSNSCCTPHRDVIFVLLYRTTYKTQKGEK